ncbi:lipoprotein [Spiroplasma endosymbiont of Cantharis nigra]|uniref:lipoprotein n=1 Tax=Spiroplasma endosymbiont of Cantharis nigra TaxID=3066278 RepID=UPI0030D097A3
MKKLLTILAATSLFATSSISVVACGGNVGKGGDDDTLPNANFELDKKNIDIYSNEVGYINITNWSILNTKSRPSVFTYNEDGIVQVTKSLKGDQLVITPLSQKVGSVKIIVASEVHSVEITVEVKKIEQESKFKLEKNSLSMKTSSSSYIKITNWDALEENAKPDKFEFENEGLASASLDSANKRIKIETESQGANNLKLIVTSKDNSHFEEILITIEASKFNLAQEGLILNIAAGNMHNGLIDSSIAVGKEGFTITDEAIINGFNTMNNSNIDQQELEIDREGEGTTEGNNGIGTSVIIRAKANSEVVEGETLLLLNQNIDPNEYFANKNLGEIRLFAGAYNRLPEVLESKDVISLGAIIFEQVGAKNTQLEYVKANFIQNLGEAGKAIMQNAKTTATTFQITNMPTLGGIFKEGIDVEFTYKFVLEDRITLFESLPENKKVLVDADKLTDKSKSAQRGAKEQIYNQLSEKFKNEISLNHFIEFTNIIFDTYEVITPGIISTSIPVDFKFDVLPGSDKLYAHDGAAWNGYINASGVAGTATGGGNLEKYEDNKKFDEKYTAGMGGFTLGGSTSGNFYQGHNIMELNQKLTTPIEYQTVGNGKTNNLNFSLENMKSEYKVTVESSDSNVASVNLIKNENYQYVIELTGKKKTGGFLGPKEPTISIKVNGFTTHTFKVKVN